MQHSRNLHKNAEKLQSFCETLAILRRLCYNSTAFEIPPIPYRRGQDAGGVFRHTF